MTLRDDEGEDKGKSLSDSNMASATIGSQERSCDDHGMVAGYCSAIKETIPPVIRFILYKPNSLDGRF